MGNWYSFYLKQLGYFLDMFDLAKGYCHNFFEYKRYEEFKEVYQELIGQTDEEIALILKGSPERYPKPYYEKNKQWNGKYAQYGYEKGERSNPDSCGGIVDLGPLLRSYLKFLYYDENPALVYPKKEKKIASQEGAVDESVNYWVISPGEHARLWNEFISENMIALGWDYLGDIGQFRSREDIEEVISKERQDGKRPFNDSKAVWEFYRGMQIGDIIYAKDGKSKIIGRGTVMGDYYFDDSKREYKSRRRVEWTNTGEWLLQHPIAQKTLTCLTAYPDLIVYINKLINGESLDEMSVIENEFKTWLSQQVKDDGEPLNDITIKHKIRAIKDIEAHYEVDIFTESDTMVLRDLKERVLLDDKYSRYMGVTGSSIDYYIRFLESKPSIEENETYSKQDFLKEVYIEETGLECLLSLLKNKRNLILKGAPGVGKTFMANRLAYTMMEEKDKSRIQMVQFHQSYSYEDFIEGYRPKAEGEGFELKQGPFVKFARKAARDLQRDYFFIIDEINRGNMSKIFGELMMLIEKDKRGESVNLLYSNQKFFVPENLYIIGMMNTADRSLALLDYALRRRFSFFEVDTAFDNETFKQYVNSLENSEKLAKVIEEVKQLNKQIVTDLGCGFRIGHSYFIDEAYENRMEERIEEVIKYEIIPQLYEYWFDDESKADDWSERLRACCDEKE